MIKFMWSAIFAFDITVILAASIDHGSLLIDALYWIVG